jgi:phage-related protein
MWLLSAAMWANPVGLVVLAIIALSAAFVIAWKKSETFREVVKTAFSAIKNTVITAIQFVVGVVLGFWDMMIGGAAKAFGWIPGLGGKLKSAAAEFTKFKDKVNSELEGLKDHDVVIRIRKVGNAAGDLSTGGGTVLTGGQTRALGGPVMAGRSYLVGERGAEVVTFPASGTVIPHGGLGSAVGGGDVHVTVLIGNEPIDARVVKVTRDQNRETKARAMSGRGAFA